MNADFTTVAVSRVNRAFGLDWEAQPFNYENGRVDESKMTANITISCVDQGATRKQIATLLNGEGSQTFDSYLRPYCWLDYGNNLDSGQVILGTVDVVEQPDVEAKTIDRLPSITELCPDIEKYDDANIPSCSMRESLNRQDLFVNRTLAPWGVHLLWQFFRH